MYSKKVDTYSLSVNNAWETFEQMCNDDNLEAVKDNIYYDLCGMEHKRWLLNKWLNGYYYSEVYDERNCKNNKLMKRFSMLDAKSVVRNGKYLPKDTKK